MERIIRKHTWPVAPGKSYYLSQDTRFLRSLILDTVFLPDNRLPHKNDVSKTCYFSYFRTPIGVHGRTGRLCYTILVVVQHVNDRDRIITAFPSL